MLYNFLSNNSENWRERLRGLGRGWGFLKGGRKRWNWRRMNFCCGRTGTKGTVKGPHRPKNKWKVMMWTLNMETECYFRFLPKICTRCKGISWKVNPSRMDFPWILRLCYFRSLSLGFWILSFVSLLFALSSGLSCLPMSNTSLLLQNCKLKHSPSCLFHWKVFSGKLNETLFRFCCWKIKKRNGRKSLLVGSD